MSEVYKYQVAIDDVRYEVGVATEDVDSALIAGAIFTILQENEHASFPRECSQDELRARVSVQKENDQSEFRDDDRVLHFLIKEILIQNY